MYVVIMPQGSARLNPAMPYTPADVERVFAEFRDVLGCPEDDRAYHFRLDAMIRCWLFEMQQAGASDVDLFESLRHALAWAGWQAVLEVASGTIH
jgi:hypothetical protein